MIKELKNKISMIDLHKSLIENNQIKQLDWDSKENEKPIYLYILTCNEVRTKLVIDWYNENEASISIIHIKNVGTAEEYYEIIKEIEDIIQSIKDYLCTNDIEVF